MAKNLSGIVSGVTSVGVFVELKNTVEGLVHVENMKDDYYNFDEQQFSLIGERKGKIYKMGQNVRVKVIGTDRILKRIDFEIV